MSLSAYDLIAMLAIAAVVFLVGRWRPALNGAEGGVRALLEELHQMAAEREQYRNLADQYERRALKAEGEVEMLRMLLRRAGVEAPTKQ